MDTPKNHGGSRIGAGRKKCGRNVSVSYRISEKAQENLSEYAQRRGISISCAVCEILEGLS